MKQLWTFELSPEGCDFSSDKIKRTLIDHVRKGNDEAIRILLDTSYGFCRSTSYLTAQQVTQFDEETCKDLPESSE